MQEWFADKVDERDSVFSFSWDGSTDKAEVLESIDDKSIKFHWFHAPKEEFLNFRLKNLKLPIKPFLLVKDFAEKKEIKDQSQLWDSQLKDLFHRIGS